MTANGPPQPDSNITLPAVGRLPVECLAGALDDVTNSYKFYWLLALLHHVCESTERVIPINELLAIMVAGVWYPTNYFRLSFGSQDRLSAIAVHAGVELGIAANARKQAIVRGLIKGAIGDTALAREVGSLAQYVPFRFLRPFFAPQLKGVADWKVNVSIQRMASESFADPLRPCLYRFLSVPATAIEIHEDWFDYLRNQVGILTGFCFWHLVNYMHKEQS